MFIKKQFSTLFEYHWHTNKQLMNCAAKLNEAEYFNKSDNSPSSLHTLLFHIIRADRGWREAIVTGNQQLPINEEDYPDLKTLQSGFEQERLSWQKLLDSLSEDEIKSSITLTRLNGDEMTFIRWRLLQHVVLHGMQHQSEIAQLLTSKGQSPGNIDFLFFN